MVFSWEYSLLLGSLVIKEMVTQKYYTHWWTCCLRIEPPILRWGRSRWRQWNRLPSLSTSHFQGSSRHLISSTIKNVNRWLSRRRSHSLGSSFNTSLWSCGDIRWLRPGGRCTINVSKIFPSSGVNLWRAWWTRWTILWPLLGRLRRRSRVYRCRRAPRGFYRIYSLKNMPYLF